MTTPSNTDKVIDSRDVIERIAELEVDRQIVEENDYDGDEAKEKALDEWDESDDGQLLSALKKLEAEASSSPDWVYGETLIHENYFKKYIEDLINDCYELPPQIMSGEWPWRHLEMDWAGAAEDAEADYMEVDFDGETYLIRA